MSVDIKIPSPGESITEVEISKWMKSDGDYVEVDEILCEIETDKATLPFPAGISGVLTIKIKEGKTANVGDVLCSIEPQVAPPVKTVKAESVKETQSAKGLTAESSTPSQTHAMGHPSPAAQKIISEQEIDIGKIQGTGRAGRITKEDVLKQGTTALVSEPSGKMEVTAPLITEESEAPSTTEKTLSRAPVDAYQRGARVTRRTPMSRLRKKLSERLVAVKNETAMLTTFNEVDLYELKRIRSQHQDRFLKKYGTKLGYMGFFTKACAETLREFPSINAMLEDNEIIFHDYVDMGIAVSAPKGLVVPVVRNAESLSIAEIEADIADLAKKARENKLSIGEMTGGTFSITNGGVFGSMLSTPIINPPQSAILGMHNIVDRAIVVEGEIKIRPVMYVALSYDHRIIDGKESVSFLFKVKEYLEDPTRLLLGV
ncbi:2-oxoglutarate dehydrogenase complex dihydrolipoyllysine-residue succinyltransferase [Deltaproteobacteria bacterium TL4]